MQRAVVAVKKNGKHEKNQILRIPLTEKDIYVGRIPKSRGSLATPRVRPTISVKLIREAVNWIASERERLLREKRKPHGKKKQGIHQLPV